MDIIGDTPRQAVINLSIGLNLALSTHYFIWDVSTGEKLDEVPIADVLTTTFSKDWKYVLMSDKKNKSVGLYEFVGH